MRAVRAASRPSQHPWTRRGRRRDRPPPPTTREGHTPDGEVGELPKDATIRGIGRERSATTFQNYHEAVAKGGLEASARREDGADHGGVLPGRRRVCAMGAGAGGLWAYDRCECGEEAGARRVFGGGRALNRRSPVQDLPSDAPMAPTKPSPSIAPHMAKRHDVMPGNGKWAANILKALSTDDFLQSINFETGTRVGGEIAMQAPSRR